MSNAETIETVELETVDLGRPLVLPAKEGEEGDIIEVLEFRNPLEAGWCLHLNSTWEPALWSNEDYLPMLAGMTGLPEDTFRLMAPSDYRKCLEIIIMAVREGPEEEPQKITNWDLPLSLRLFRPYDLTKVKRQEEVTFRNELITGMCLHLPGHWDVTQWVNRDFLPMMTGMSNLPSVVFKKMSPYDFRKVQEVIIHFL